MEAERLSRALGCRLIRTSVKEDVNVAAVFRHLAARCLAELREPPPSPEHTYHAGGALPHTRTISAFNPSHSAKSHNGTIILRSGKRAKNGKKKNVLKNACRLV
ncbi:ras-related protein Rab-23-like [Chrysoperla carnea]|uniref:ras-related protein Rab-23-like n=1 Tax=Chrysoperla carnea TaxID=189513 RepID=UPI001D06CAEE|nr:ras-related protein Rab-23-like [Chrysoperla carnea]